jgi:protocatechuate 3,4-dioxygenase beta subunit
LRVEGRAAEAKGTPVNVVGRVRNAQGRPLADAVVEIWQCDARGIYLHPRDRDGRDENFQGYGMNRTDAAGTYGFRTIRPVPYTGRTPHIHFKVTAPGMRSLTTQMYVAGEAQNERDGVYRWMSKAERELVTVALEPKQGLRDAKLMGVFDIVVG